MKRLFSLLLAFVAALTFSLPANATIAKSSTFTRYGNSFFYTALITATANDTTATTDSNTITNLDGSVKTISAGVKATNQTGTSPTLTLSLIGSYDNSTWFIVQSAQASTAGTTANIATGALGIGTASTTNVSTGFSTNSYGRTGGLPPYLRIRVTVGGSDTPGWTGVVYTVIER